MKFKKLCSIILAVSMLGTSSAMLTANAAEADVLSDYVMGDLNLDGTIKVEDIVDLQNYLDGDYTPPYTAEKFLKIADVNEDGVVDDNDVDSFSNAFVNTRDNLGNVNGDDRLSVVDATNVQKYLVGVEDFGIGQILNADFNKDSRVSVVDATEIQKKLADYKTFPSTEVKEADKKYREKYASNIAEIEATNNFSFSNVYVLKKPAITSGSDSMYVRDENWCYKVTGNGDVWIYGCYSTNETLVLPTYLNGYKIEGISEFFCEEDMFPNYPTEQSTVNNIKSIIVPSDVALTFRVGCFEGLTELQSVVFQEGITWEQFIEGDVFKDCDNLQNVVWPSSMTKVPYGMFDICSKITSIEQLNLPTTVDTIQENAFHGTSISEVIVPEHIKTIGDNAFWYIPARTVTVLSKSPNLNISGSAFNCWQNQTIDKKIVIYGYKGSGYDTFVNGHIDTYKQFLEWGLITSMDAMPYEFNYLN